ncbi:unnamed protein product [Urochloa decumbens]|uniref:DUF1618 domain-containing protein n=1 Tax=Urochloa decumbens TaxID=240449 RepID=A0ABC9FQW8_9POAL
MVAGGGAALPKWVMLERFVFRRDDPASFRGDARTTAASTTSFGAPFRVSFLLADPPTPYRLYLSLPDGPSHDHACCHLVAAHRGLPPSAPPSAHDHACCHLVAAHRGLLLLRLDYLIDESKPFGLGVHDYFIYLADPPSHLPPLLRRLPHCTEHNSFFEMQVTRAFSPLAIGLLCRGEGEFAVAHLAVVRCHVSDVTSEMQAELCVLRSSSVSCGDDDAKWETKILPIQHRDDEYLDFLYWAVNAVVPFENSLCWVDYSRGILFCDGIFGEDNPKVTYIRFPQDSFVQVDHSRARKGLYRSLCVAEGGRQLVFVDIACHDGTGSGPMTPGTGFTMTFRTLKVMTEDVGNGRSMQWEWIVLGCPSFCHLCTMDLPSSSLRLQQTMEEEDDCTLIRYLIAEDKPNYELLDDDDEEMDTMVAVMDASHGCRELPPPLNT